MPEAWDCAYGYGCRPLIPSPLRLSQDDLIFFDDISKLKATFQLVAAPQLSLDQDLQFLVEKQDGLLIPARCPLLHVCAPNFTFWGSLHRR